MNITTLSKQERSNEVISSLSGLWNRSVRVTHNFLSEKDFKNLEPYAGQALAEVPVLAVAETEDGVAGFIGLSEDKIEMLFIDPAFIGKGIGRKLVDWAINEKGIRLIDVNEQNTYAVSVYTHWGFKTYDRSEIDDQGNPFPILRMRLA